jgi:hypothetical protein
MEMSEGSDSKHNETEQQPADESLRPRDLERNWPKFDELSDPLKVGANLWLGARLFQSIARGLGILQYLL